MSATSKTSLGTHLNPHPKSTRTRDACSSMTRPCNRGLLTDRTQSPTSGGEQDTGQQSSFARLSVFEFGSGLALMRMCQLSVLLNFGEQSFHRLFEMRPLFRGDHDRLRFHADMPGLLLDLQVFSGCFVHDCDVCALLAKKRLLWRDNGKPSHADHVSRTSRRSTSLDPL